MTSSNILENAVSNKIGL